MPQQEPVVSAAALAGLISAGISFCRLMGWVALDDEQYNSLMIFVSLVLPIATGIWARQRVTPVAAPMARNTEGETVPLVPIDGSQLKGKA